MSRAAIIIVITVLAIVYCTMGIHVKGEEDVQWNKFLAQYPTPADVLRFMAQRKESEAYVPFRARDPFDDDEDSLPNGCLTVTNESCMVHDLCCPHSP